VLSEQAVLSFFFFFKALLTERSAFDRKIKDVTSRAPLQKQKKKGLVKKKLMFSSKGLPLRQLLNQAQLRPHIPTISLR
jgi:hypothetical protein